jgi:hypothetical protein
MNNEVVTDLQDCTTQTPKKVWMTPEIEKVEFLETLAANFGTLASDGVSLYSSN